LNYNFQRLNPNSNLFLMTSLLQKQLTFHDSIKTFSIPQIRDALERDRQALNTQDPKVPSPYSINHQIGWTALYKTIVYGQREICEFLLAAGSDPNLPNRVNPCSMAHHG
jgi:ankyrin repeat protein